MLYNIKLDVSVQQRNELKAVLDGEPNVPHSTDLFRVVLQDLTETQKLTILRQLSEQELSNIERNHVTEFILSDASMPEPKSVETDKLTANISNSARNWLPNQYVWVNVYHFFKTINKKYMLTIIDQNNKLYNIQNVERDDDIKEFILPDFKGPIYVAIISKIEDGPTGTTTLIDQPKGLNGPAA
jgi:hypothetical protein